MKIQGQIDLPGDKSISHRALMIASLSSKTSTIKNLASGKDVKSTESCLKNCGISINNNLSIGKVINGDSFQNPIKELDCGNSGTTIRLLSGLLAGKKIEATLFGDRSLSNRPMGRIIRPLSQMRLNISSKNDKPPISIKKSDIQGIEYHSNISSAQVKSAVIFSGLGAINTTTYYEPLLSRNHTEIMLESVGADIKTRNNKIEINNLSHSLLPLNMKVPADPSTAAFFAGAVSLLTKSELIIKNLLTNPTRFEFFNIIKSMGIRIELLSENFEGGESVSDIFIESGKLKSVNIQEKQVPSLIDEIPILAVIATQASGITTIRGAKELRFKESDRIESILYNLRNMGATVKEFSDGFSVTGPTKLKGTMVRTYGDHRIAMAFTIAGLIATGDTKLDNYECINISFPGFFDTLKSIIT